MLRTILTMLSLALSLFVMGDNAKNTSTNKIKITTYTDTVYDPSLPAIEIKLGTYHNYPHTTTVGYKMILRDTEIDIRGALLYKEDSILDVASPLHLLSPFHAHAGNSSDKNRIDHVYVEHQFPFSAHFSKEDSLVILTDKGNFTLYMDEERRAAAQYQPVINSLSNRLKNTTIAIITLIGIIVITMVCTVIRLRRIRARRNNEMNRLMAIISENDMNNRKLQSDVTSLMQKQFEALNRLCYEYFEKADTPFLKKSIYNEVENEINHLKDSSKIKELEDALNKYCGGIMQKISEQLPDLSDKDRVLLIYLYSGLSARAICILTDIQIKNFYMRRHRLKARILASDAPDRETFAALM